MLSFGNSCIMDQACHRTHVCMAVSLAGQQVKDCCTHHLHDRSSVLRVSIKVYLQQGLECQSRAHADPSCTMQQQASRHRPPAFF